jgi:hypothetical protein
MPGFSVETATAQLALWLAAETALASSQSYEITVEGNTRKLTRANLKDVAERIAFWRAELARAERTASGRSRTRYFVN